MLCAYAVTVLLAAQTPAQPDFSGRWVLAAPDSAPADVPSVLIIQQHLRRTDIRGNPMQPFWELLTVEGDDSKSGIRSGIYRIGVGSGTVGGIDFPRRTARESILWDRDRLIITSEEWMERQDGTRESYERHREAWALDQQGRLVIIVSDSNGETRTRTVTYKKEPGRR